MVPSPDILSAVILHNITKLGVTEYMICSNTLGADDSKLLGLGLGIIDVVNIGTEDGFVDSDVVGTIT